MLGPFVVVDDMCFDYFLMIDPIFKKALNTAKRSNIIPVFRPKIKIIMGAQTGARIPAGGKTSGSTFYQ